jgi:hypothetical protein
MSQEAWTAYDKAISAAQEKFLELDASGNAVLKKGVTPQILRDFLYAFADPQFVGKDNVDALKKLFDQWVLDPNMPGGTAPQQGITDLPAIMKAIQDLLASQKGANLEVPAPPKGGVETMDQPIGGGLTMGMAAGPLAGWGAESNKNAIQGEEENKAAAELEKMYPGLSSEDKKMADWAIPELRKSGVSTNWKTIYATLQALRNKYRGSQSDIIRSKKK